jgi:hypothetical protein
MVTLFIFMINLTILNKDFFILFFIFITIILIINIDGMTILITKSILQYQNEKSQRTKIKQTKILGQKYTNNIYEREMARPIR